MCNVWYVLVFFGIVSTTNSARILGIVPAPSYSHQIVYRPLWRELSLRGHHVTLLTTDPMNDSSLTNLTEIDLSASYDIWGKVNIAEFSNMSFFTVIDFVSSCAIEINRLQLEHPQVQALLKNKNEHFDVVLAEGIFTSMYAFSVRFNCPLVAIMTFDPPYKFYKMIGNPVHPVLTPDYILPYGDHLNFYERLISVAWTLFNTFYLDDRMVARQQPLVEEYFGKSYPHLSDIEKNISLMFINVDPVFHRIRPLLPNTIPVGGGIHVKHATPLPNELQKRLDSATEGFIYFSLGSNVKSTDLPLEKRKIILETFSELPYLVLWKFELEDLLGKPNNVLISKWFPQQDVFKHPNIKVFISQCGLQSTDEAIHHHIPIIGIPFMGDQQKNIQYLVDKGVGVQLDIQTLNKETFKITILEVIKNSKYRNNIKELSSLIRDQPMTGLERAVWWTEYVIRHKGAKHLKSPAIDLPSYQYYLLDVIGFCILVLIIFIFILTAVLKFLFRLVKKPFCSSKVKSE